ncbi:MAG: hypothetical protein JO303_03435, partial [Caulobacteraceae bacterium]|nr:hypothetical protein [Caulobacteraceae bacterium]
GRHFRAMSNVLTSAFPEAEIVGLFLARRVWEGPRPPAWVAQRDGARPGRRS